MDQLSSATSAQLDTAARTELYKEFQREVAADLPLINVAEWGFITVARDSVENVASMAAQDVRSSIKRPRPFDRGRFSRRSRSYGG